MPTSSPILFVLTDGGRARFVRRSAASGHFENFEEMAGLNELEAARERLRSGTLARTHSSTTPRRAAVAREGTLRAAKEGFLDRVADHAADLFRKQHFSGIFIAAPARLIAPLEARLQNRACLTGRLSKDLTKSPIERLDHWLGDVFPTGR